MNFIELNGWGEDNRSINIHIMMITALEEIKVEPKKTVVHLMGSQSFAVTNTVLEIKSKIKEAETFKITTFDPKGPK